MMSTSNRTAKSTRSGTRSPCKVCNNLDPRRHSASLYHDRISSAGKPKAKSKAERVDLNLPLDLWLLKRSSGKSKDSCRWCGVLCEALDGLLPEWRKESSLLRVTCEVGMRRLVRLVVSRKQRDAKAVKEDVEKVVEIYRTLSMFRIRVY
jgi:hypothetical protein